MSLSLFSRLSKLFSAPDVAIDLGTANTRIYATGCGVVADQPTMVKISYQSKPGNSNFKELGIVEEQSDFVMPLEGGVVKSVSATSILLKQLLQKAVGFGFGSPRVIVCAPSDVSNHERSALFAATRSAGVSAVTIVPEPLAAAIGAGLDVSSPYAQMLVDIGDGVTDVAIIRNGKLIQTTAARTAGSNLHAAVRRMVKEQYRINLFKNEAEILALQLGAVGVQKAWTSFMLTHGINNQGREESITVNSRDVREAIKPVINTIGETVCRAVREMSPEVSAEVIETGLCLTGGVAKLPGIVEFIAAETNLEVRTAPDSLHSVINGAGKMLETASETNFWLN
jgi:rod shape-determining protein MreB